MKRNALLGVGCWMLVLNNYLSFFSKQNPVLVMIPNNSANIINTGDSLNFAICVDPSGKPPAFKNAFSCQVFVSCYFVVVDISHR